ncbi:MAG: autotransporter outer membrane beta-barrel domain-containing protein [Alphaproteobacteria bacterium]|nr:autotransporter outer membrane beta-barrel domain-containing protein [Alphaproteobacteria bacterium]
MFIGLVSTPAFADQIPASYSINPASFGITTDASSVSMSGKSMSSLTTLALSAGHEFNQTVSRRQNKLHSFSNGIGTSQVFFGEADDIELQKKAEKVFDAIGKQFGFSSDDIGTLPQFWTSDFKRKGIVGNDGGTDRYNYDLSGFAGGMDVHAGTSWNFGVAAGYTRATSRFEALARTATAVDAYQASLYATYEHELGSIDSNVSFNKFENKSERSIVGTGLDSTADAKGKGYQIAWTLSAMGHGEYDKFSLTPLTGFTFTKLHRGGLTEDGAGFYDLNSASANSTSLKPMIGIDVARNYVYQSDIEIKPEIYGIYRYETMDTTENTTNHLQQLDTIASTTSTALSRHSMQIGSSVSVKIGERFTSKLQFDSDLQPSSHSYSGVFKVNYNW